MEAGIKDILIISTPCDTPRFEELLGDGSKLGIKLSYAVQPSPDGLAQAFLIGEEFIGGDSVAMILGDNIFYGHGFSRMLKEAGRNADKGKATIFGYGVRDPQRFGIVEIDKDGNALSVEEKPAHPKSNYCITGLYFYDNRAVKFAKSIKPSKRGELEITDINRMYLDSGDLTVQILDRGFAWLDTGTMDSLFEASEFVRVLSQRQDVTISAPEEIAYGNGWIGRDRLVSIAESYGKSSYGAHLKKVAGIKEDN